MNPATIDLLRKRLAPPLALAVIAYFYGRIAVAEYLDQSPQDAHIGLACAVVIFEVIYLFVVLSFTPRWTAWSTFWQGVKVVVTAVIITVIGLYAFVDMSFRATVMRSLSGGVKQFGIAHFEELDGDHDGTIGSGELQSFKSDGLGDVDKAMLTYMNAHFQEVGHVVSSESRQYMPTKWSQAETSKPAYYPIVTYGIDKIDLLTFPERALGVLKDW